MLIWFVEEARREGLLALGKHGKDIGDHINKWVLRRAIDGTGPELLQEIMEPELEKWMSAIKKRHDILDAIEPSMAVAMITAFYGAGLGQSDYSTPGRKTYKLNCH